MYAIIKTCGKQFKVKEGDIVLFDKMSLNPKDTVEFKEVLLICDKDNNIKVGSPIIENSVIHGEVINEGRDKKIVIFKKRRRKDSKLKKGFRRDFTRVRITKIEIA